jgi:hypothetical protein
MGFIDADRLRGHATALGKTELGHVLMELAEGETGAKLEPLEIPDVKLITPHRFQDPRGFFSETWNQRGFAEAGIPGPFIQDNHVLSTVAGVPRGLHCQIGSNAQGKLVRAVEGAIYDVAVDVRDGSPTFGRYVAATLRLSRRPDGDDRGHVSMVGLRLMVNVAAYTAIDATENVVSP